MPSVATPGHRRLRSGPWPQVLLPGLAMLLGAVLAMSLTWGMGARFGLRGSEVRPEAVLSTPADAAAAGALEQRARRFAALAEAAETRALAHADPDTLRRYREQAKLYQDWSREVAARAGAREAALATREARRTLWAYSTALDLLVCSVAGLIALGIALRPLRRLRAGRRISRRTAAVLFTVIAVVPAAVYAVVYSVWEGFDTPAYRLARAAVPADALRVVGVDDSLHVAMALVYVAASWVAVAAPTLLRRDGGAEDVDRCAREIAHSMRLVRYTLYMGATILVVYVATVSSFFHWVSAFVEPGTEGVVRGVDALARSAVTARSFLATGLVLAVYLPSSMSLSLMAWELAERALPAGTVSEREEWMKAHGVAAPNTLSHLKPVAAILAPVLTGPIADVLQHAIA